MEELRVRYEDLYHTGIVVADMADAQKELSDVLGVTWGPQGKLEAPVLLEDGPREMTFEYAYTAEGPHHLELVTVIPGTLWSLSPPGHAHHTGYWCDDVAGVSAALSAKGLPLLAKVGTDQADAPAMVVYHRGRSGLYIELVDRIYRESLFGPGQ
jgi:hypothetical protein